MRIITASIFVILFVFVQGNYPDTGIYPDTLWRYSKKLSDGNFTDVIKKEIEAGNTIFVRWLPSPWSAQSKKQAPTWNKITKAFAENPFVSFGDVMLADQSGESALRGAPHNPGTGGWPTIRYFNKETELIGGNYKQTTDKTLCEELSDKKILATFVKEHSISVCSISNLSMCTKKEKAYIKKMKSNSKDDQLAQLLRLTNMEEGKMMKDLKLWVSTRKKILEQLVHVEQEL